MMNKLALLLTLVACGKSDKSDPSGKDPAAASGTESKEMSTCDYLSDADVGAIFTTVKPPLARDAKQMSKACHFTNIPDSANATNLQLEVTLDRNQTFKDTTAATTLTARKTKEGAEEVSGLGDRAVWADNTLYVAKADALVVVLIFEPMAGHELDKKALASAVAQKVLAKL